MRREREKRMREPGRLPANFERLFRRSLSRRAQLFGLGLFSCGLFAAAALFPVVGAAIERWGEGVLYVAIGLAPVVWTAFCWMCARLFDILWPPAEERPKSRNRRRWEQAELDEAYAAALIGHGEPGAFLGLACIVALVVVCYLSGEVLWASVLAGAIAVAFLLVYVLMKPTRSARHRS